MSDHTTRLALWALQGHRSCMYCGRKVYVSETYGLQHVDADICGTPRMAAHMSG